MERLAFGLGEIKFAGSESDGAFSGYGAAFGNVDSYGDVIKQGAFRRTLREAKKSGRWPAMLAQHGGWGMSSDDFMPIGIWTSMEEDEKGLYVEGKLALDTQRGRDAYALLKMQPRPALDGLSIGYIAKKFTVGTKPEEPRRLLEDVDLLEISLVTWPANGLSRIDSVKNFDPREFEDALRDAGLSRSDAVKAVAVFKSRQRDAGLPESAPCDEAAAADVQSLAARFKRLRGA